MAEKLGPCLLCSGTSVGFRDHGLPETQIGCNDCGLTTRYYPSRAEAIAAWNDRPAPKADSALVSMSGGKDAFGYGTSEFASGFVQGEAATRAALSDRDVVLEGLLRECRDVLDGLNDDEINVEFLPRIDAALKGGVDE